MTKINIFSGFLGAGKTTLIKKLIKEAYAGEKLVLIENEFGEIGVDGGFLKDAGVEITEMNSGCICCSLVGDFSKALVKVLEEYSPDRILIEPSGVGKLSDVIKAVAGIDSGDIVLDGFATVADAGKCKMYMKNFGEFFNDQIEHAGAIILSRTGDIAQAKLDTCLELIKQHNDKAVIITTPWDELDGKKIAAAIERRDTLADELKELMHEHHHHHHDHDEHCDCGCHDHEHHHHHADDVFSSWGKESAKKFTAEEIKSCLEAFDESHKYGTVLRAKGIVPGADGKWIYFDYVPGEADVRTGEANVTGRLCVIGSGLDEEALCGLFGV